MTKVVLIMNSCFIMYNAPLVEDANVVQLTSSFCEEQLVLCQLQIDLIIFEVQIVLVTVQDNIEIVRISLKLYT